jgi:transcription initiation factor TFIID subunit 6
MQLLEPELHLEKQKNEMKRKEAWRVYGALLVSSELSLNSFYCILVEQLKPS